MDRKLFVLLVFTLGLVSTAQAQSRPRRVHTSPTPAWLPRGVLVGASLREELLTTRLKVQWEWAFFQDRKDAFVFLLEGGVG
ncbi:hypothetical protein FJV41_48050, partial [Myxococcus llanfairpwllgwyngyllgogerychwyrndrobwllllantysiliogogogochensis]